MVAYKDKALQRETTRLRVGRYRDNQKALHQGVTSVKTPDPLLDPAVNPPLRPQALPNCPDGRYRPYSKESQLGVKASRQQAGKGDIFSKLKTKYDVRNR